MNSSNAATPPVSRPIPVQARRAGFQYSAAEQTSSWIVALLICIGICVACMIVMWITSRIVLPTRAVPVELVETSGGGDGTIGGGGVNVEAPSLDELIEQTDVVALGLPQLIATMPTAISRRKSPPNEASLSGNPDASLVGAGGSGGKGSGPGSGEGQSGLSRAQRWEVRLGEGRTLNVYAAALDHFGIELGLLDASPNVTYLSRFTLPKPQVRSAARDAEQRLYLSWRRGSLREADQELATRGGVSPAGKTIVQFVPPATEESLAQLEYAFAKRQPFEIRRTVFGVREKNKQFEFYVIEQLPLAVK